MAIFQAASLIVSAAAEAASLVWMELAMFGLAAMAYVLYVGLGPLSRNAPKASAGKKIPSRKGLAATKEGSAEAGNPEKGPQGKLSDHSAHGDCRAALSLWEQAKGTPEALQLDLAVVVDAMRKLGNSVPDVIAELRCALDKDPQLVASVTTLVGTLLRDDAMELLDAVLLLLEEKHCPADVTAYAGLMAAQLRRRDYAAVAATAARLPSEKLTPRIRAMLAGSAAHRGRLDEALGQLRQMPEPAEGAKSVLPPSTVAQIFALGAREQRVWPAAQELARLRTRLDQKYFEEMLTADAWSCNPVAIRELLDAGATLGVSNSANALRALAYALARAADATGLHALIAELEAEAAKGPTGISVGEPLALVLLDASRAVRDGASATRALSLHRDACAGAPGGKVLAAACGALVACDHKEAACNLYEQEMVPKGVWLDASLVHALLKAAAALGRTELAQQMSDRAGAARAVAQNGSSGGSSGDIQRHATMIKAYARDRNLGSAETVFNRLRESGVALSPLIYNCFLDACVQCGDLERAAAHFAEMKEQGFIDVVGYNTMIKAMLGQGRVEEARALMKDMASRGLQANKVTYNELLHARVLARDRTGMWGIVDEMKAAGVRANPVTCSILLKSLTAHAGPSDIRRVITLVEEIEGPIDEVLFSSVIEACIRIKQLDLLSDLMRRYRHKDGCVTLAAPTYGSMIKAYGQAGNVARVRELWQEMEEQGVKPTSITLGCLTEALVINGHPDEAWNLLQKQLECEERRGCINTVIYSTVLKGFATARRMDKVFVVYREMQSKGIPCNTITYNTLLDACAKSCAMTRASQLLEDMAKSCVEPDIITYSTLVKGYCAEGDVDRAFHILEEMKQDNKFAPDEIMYNSILDGCAKQHRVEDALRMLDEMKSNGVIPSNYTLSILVKLLGHARRLNQAFKMVEDMSTQHGFRPNVQVYTCLVQACILNRRLEKALALHDTMLADEGCRVDDKFYAVLARGCLQLHQPMKAAEVVRAAYQLSGHCLALPARRGAPVGVDSRALEEVTARLQAGSAEEQHAVAELTLDLQQQRGLSLGDLNASSGGRDARRRRGGGGYGGGGPPGRR